MQKTGLFARSIELFWYACCGDLFSSKILFYVVFFNYVREYIQKARTAKRFGIILGTLGRQGNVSIFNRIRQQLLSKGKTAMQFLMAEVVPSKLALVTSVDVSKEEL